MASKVRKSANNVDVSSLTVNERILRDCHAIYTDEDKGLVSIADSVGIRLLPPRRKITVMLMGNHSAGKSTFINWYVEETIQRTGVAIETQGFTFITSGKKRESLMGQATFLLYPHFRPLQQIPGVPDYISTEVSTSKQKKFPLVTFIDTPGLVDGEMQYPFDVNEAIEFLGGLCDMIFVFFDPIGQALCKRTLNIVEKLNEKHGDKLRFYLSKADTAGHESDRQKVLMQITQELCKRPGLNKCGFEMPTIFVPIGTDKPPRCTNQIEDVCRDVERTIHLAIQSTLNTLEKDCHHVAQRVDEILLNDRQTRARNLKSRLSGSLLTVVSFLLPLLVLVHWLLVGQAAAFVESLLGAPMAALLRSYLTPLEYTWSLFPADQHVGITVGLLVGSLSVFLISCIIGRTSPTLSRQQKSLLASRKAHITEHVIPTKDRLYAEYLKQSVGDQDLS